MNVKSLCLGALTLGDATGYEIRKMFDEGPFGQFFDASYGSIYPALSSLLDDGLVSVTEMAQEKRPDKKVYTLTPEGLAHFKAALAEPPTKDKVRSEHVVRLFFADYMTQEDLIATIDSYLAHFEEQIERLHSLESDGVKPGRMFAKNLGLTFYEGVAEYLRENRNALIRDIAAERMNDNFEPSKLQGVGDD